MPRPGAANALRVLNLTLNLINTQVGLTREDLQRRMGEYSSLKDASLRRTFERDLSSIRAVGLIVEVIDADPPRYRICGSSFPAPEVSFSPQDVKLLTRAAAAWEGLGNTELNVLTAKLGVYVTGLSQASSPGTAVIRNLEGADYLPAIVQAIERRQPIHFTYASRRGVEKRDVAPWSLLLRGRAVYLNGFDLNRWGSRIFRLSRIASAIEFVGEADAYEIPSDPPVSDDENIFRVSPLVWVRENFGARIRMKCGAVLTRGQYPEKLAPRVGWDLLQGELDDQTVWERLLLDDCENAVPAERTELRANLERLFKAGCGWEKQENGK